MTIKTILATYNQTVEEFNLQKSFNLFYPDPNDYELIQKLDKYIKVIDKFKQLLITNENLRKRNQSSDEMSTEICRFVVHMNHLTKRLKPFDEDDIYLQLLKIERTN